MARMVKKKREDYWRVAEFKVPFKLPGIEQTMFKVTVLADLDELLNNQGALAVANKFKANKQTYGPFRVSVKEVVNKPKEEET
jgi:hypothetical protein